MGLRGRYSIPAAWLLLVVGMCILAAVAADVGYAILRRHRTSSARAVNAQYPLPEVSGVFRLTDPIYGAGVLSVGGPCKGLGPYDSILGGTPVVVKDQGGAPIATGTLDIGKVEGRSTCEFAVLIQALPKADSYQFEVADHDVQSYRYADLAARGWQVALSLG